MGQRVSDRYKSTLNKLLILSALRFGCHCGRADTEYVRARRQRGEMWNVIPCMHHNNSLIIGLHQMWHWVHVRPALSTTSQGREGAPALSFTSELLLLIDLGVGETLSLVEYIEYPPLCRWAQEVPVHGSKATVTHMSLVYLDVSQNKTSGHECEREICGRKKVDRDGRDGAVKCVMITMWGTWMGNCQKIGVMKLNLETEFKW